MDIVEFLKMASMLHPASAIGGQFSRGNIPDRSIYQGVGAGGWSANNDPDAYARAMQETLGRQQPQPQPQMTISPTLQTLLNRQGLPDAYLPQPPPESVSPPVTVQSQRPARRRVSMGYDAEALDALMASLSEGVTDGPNSRIDDETRRRGLEWALRNAG